MKLFYNMMEKKKEVSLTMSQEKARWEDVVCVYNDQILINAKSDITCCSCK